MDKRVISCVLFLALVSFDAHAASGTKELLSGPVVRDVLEIRLVPGDGKIPGVEYRADPSGNKGFRTLIDDQTFVAADEIDLAFPDFNPLRYAVTTSETLVADENFNSVKKFIDALLGLGKVVFPKRADLDKVIKSANALVTESEAEDAEPCEAYSELRRALANLQTQTETEIVGKSDLESWIEGSTGLDGVKATRLKIQAKSREVDDVMKQIDELEKKLAEIARLKDEPSCSEIKASTFAQVYELSRDVPRTKQVLETMKKSLDGLVKALEPFTERTKWRGEERTTWVFHKVSPTLKDGKNVKIAIRQTGLAFQGDGIVVKTEAEATRSLVLRHYSLLVPEFAAAMIFSDVSYPKWGTKEENGKTVVAAAKDEKSTLEGALMLNLVCRCWGPTFLYPAFQLGVSSAKDVPGLLAGIGLRFTYPTSLSLMGGRMLTWAKDLDKLKPGDPISGTAALESDLKLKRQPTAWYIALQYNF